MESEAWVETEKTNHKRPRIEPGSLSKQGWWLSIWAAVTHNSINLRLNVLFNSPNMAACRWNTSSGWMAGLLLVRSSSSIWSGKNKKRTSEPHSTIKMVDGNYTDFNCNEYAHVLKKFPSRVAWFFSTFVTLQRESKKKAVQRMEAKAFFSGLRTGRCVKETNRKRGRFSEKTCQREVVYVSGGTSCHNFSQAFQNLQ